MAVLCLLISCAALSGVSYLLWLQLRTSRAREARLERFLYARAKPKPPIYFTGPVNEFSEVAS